MNLTAAFTGSLVAVALAGYAQMARPETANVVNSTVTLQDTEQPGAVVEVRFNNSTSDGERQQSRFTLSHGVIVIDVLAIVGDADPDTIHVTPPEGYACVPSCDLTLQDGQSGVLFLYRYVGL